MKWMFALGGLLLGLYFGFVGRALFTVQFKNEFDIVDVFGIVFALIIAFLLQNYLTQRFTAGRIEKDLAIEQAKAFLDVSRDVRRTVETSHRKGTLTMTDLLEITAETKKLGVSLSLLEDSVKVFFSNKLNRQLESVKSEFLRYRQVITGKTANEAYSQADHSQEQHTYKSLNDQILRLIRAINLV